MGSNQRPSDQKPSTLPLDYGARRQEDRKKIGASWDRAWCGFLVLPFWTRRRRWWTLRPRSNAAIIPCANAPRFSDVRDDCIMCAAGKEEAEGCTSPSIRWRHVRMAQDPWLYIYIKGRSRYKEAVHKISLWEAKAKSMGLECAALKTWYKSMRTKIGKITNNKSGSATKTLTDREKYLKEKFRFLGDHIVRQPSRVALSLKSHLQPQHLLLPNPWTHPANRGANSSGKLTTASCSASSGASSSASSSATDPSESESLPRTSCWCRRIAYHTAHSARPECSDPGQDQLHGLDEWFWAMFEPTWTWPNFTFGQLFMWIGANNDQIWLPMG